MMLPPGWHAVARPGGAPWLPAQVVSRPVVSRGVPWRPKTGVLTQIPSVPIRDVPHPWLELIKRFLGGVKFKAAFPLN